MLANLIIKDMTVVREVEVLKDFWMYGHVTLPYFDMEKMPFVIFNDF